MPPCGFLWPKPRFSAGVGWGGARTASPAPSPTLRADAANRRANLAAARARPWGILAPLAGALTGALAPTHAEIPRCSTGFRVEPAMTGFGIAWFQHGWQVSVMLNRTNVGVGLHAPTQALESACAARRKVAAVVLCLAAQPTRCARTRPCGPAVDRVQWSQGAIGSVIALRQAARRGLAESCCVGLCVMQCCPMRRSITRPPLFCE
jgi:hypothetical protein